MVESTYDLMVDIETLGRKPGCVIVQVGWSTFLPEAPDAERREGLRYVDWQKAQTVSAIDPETLAWWLAQPREVMREVFLSEGRVSVHQVAMDLMPWIQNARNIWARGPSYDYEILFDAFETYSTLYQSRSLWREFSRKSRDERVCRDALQMMNYKLSKRVGDQHNALDDVRTQIANVHQFYNALRSKS